VWIGILLSLVSLAGMFVDVPIGMLCDHTSRRKLMMVGLGVLALVAILILNVPTLGLLIPIFLLAGIGYQMWRVPRDAKYASLTTEKHRSKLYGADAEIKYLAVVIGTVLGGFLLGKYSTRGVLIFYLVLVALSFIVVRSLVRETNNRSFLKALATPKDFRYKFAELRRIRNFGLNGILLLYLSLLFAFWGGVLWALQPLLYGPHGLGLTPALGGLLLACFAIPGIFLSFWAGKLADRVGKTGVLFVGMMITGIAIVGFSMSTEITSVFAFAILAAIGEVLSLPALAGLIVNLSYGRRKGELAGIWDMFIDIGFFLGPLCAGICAHLLGIRYTFTALGVLILVSSLVVFAVHPLRERRTHSAQQKRIEAVHQSYLHVTPLRKRHSLKGHLAPYPVRPTGKTVIRR